MDHWNGAENSVARAFFDAAIDFDFTEPDYAYDLRQYLPIFDSDHMNLESSDGLFNEETDYSVDGFDEHVVQMSSIVVPSESFGPNNGQWDGELSLESPDGDTQEEGSQETVTSPVKESSPCESSWTPGKIMESENSAEYVCLSWGYMKEEHEEELKMTGYWEKNELNYCQVSSDFGLVEVDSEIKYDFRGNGSSITTQKRMLGVRKPGEKRQTKPEKVISLEVLRQHFARSLKDAAKSMGVCPTTLKRICRQHGITRWPSRKIKKVNHSLKRLQLVVDSVKGAEGLIQIGSLYSTYPELSSPDNLPKTGHFASDELFNTSKDAQPHPQFALNTHKCDNSSELNKPAKILNGSSDEDLHLPIACTKILPPISEDGGALKVKATFGESNIRFTLQPQWNFKDLQHEIARRFAICDFSAILLKYIDSDLESVLLTCDEDLDECKELFMSSSCHIVKMYLHQSPMSLTGSSCTMTCLV